MSNTKFWEKFRAGTWPKPNPLMTIWTSPDAIYGVADVCGI